MSYDAVLIVSFGGPEAEAEVIPFLENVLRGRNVPRERLLQVAAHYYHFGGRSPLNQHCRELVAALSDVIDLPVYWGNRNWRPLLADTVRQMQADGVRRALAIATSAYASWSGCRQYIENVAAARAEAGPAALEIHKLPPFADHPLFVRATTARVRAATDRLPGAPLVFTAHSIPSSMAATCRYEEQLRETAGQVAAAVAAPAWSLAWQSRSGPPTQPWLAPDILDRLRAMAAEGAREVVVAPIGFLSEHMEVIYDLDVEAAALCRELGMRMERATTVGTHPDLIELLRQQIEAAQSAPEPVGCPPDCCPPPRR